MPQKVKPAWMRPSRNTYPWLFQPVSLTKPSLVKTNEGDCLAGAHTASAMTVATTELMLMMAKALVIWSRTRTMKSCGKEKKKCKKGVRARP